MCRATIDWKKVRPENPSIADLIRFSYPKAVPDCTDCIVRLWWSLGGGEGEIGYKQSQLKLKLAGSKPTRRGQIHVPIGDQVAPRFSLITRNHDDVEILTRSTRSVGQTPDKCSPVTRASSKHHLIIDHKEASHVVRVSRTADSPPYNRQQVRIKLG